MRELCCMCFLGRGNGEILVAGRQDRMYKVDVVSGRLVEEVRSRF